MRSSGITNDLASAGNSPTLFKANLVAIQLDGASINLARSFAPASISSMWSSGNWLIGQD